MTLFLATAGVISGFAVEMPDDYSVEASAYAEQSGDTSSYEVIASENANYPKVTGFSNTADGTKVSWSAYSGAAKYRLYVYSGNTWKRVGESTKLNYTHTSLNNGTTYIYTVRALDKNNNFISDYSRQGYANTFYAPPAVSKLENVYGGVNVKWNGNNGINNYRIYRKTNNSGWRYIGDAYGSTYLDNSAVSGMNYTYTVRCMDSNGKLVSSYNSGKSIAYVKAPSVNKIENTATGSKISWSKCEGAVKYRVYCLDSNNSWKGIATTGSISFTHDKLTTGTKYTYTVRCLDSKGNFVSGYNKSGKSNLFLAPPTISGVSKAENGNLIKWNSVSGVAGYRLYRKTVGSSWSVLADVTSGNSYVDTSAKNDNIYSYTLRCLDKNGSLISSYISDTKYYYNGSLANGKVSANGETYYFSNGLFRSGLQTINGNKYYYNSSGVLQKNGIVGSDKDGWYYADKNGKIDFTYSNAVTQNGKDWIVRNGKATKVSTKSDRTLFRAMKIVAKITDNSMSKSQKLKVCYNYVKNSYTELNPRIPHYTGNDWPIIYANDMFVDGAGNCFSYAAAFAYMAKAIGYENVYCCNSGGHGWAEIDGLIYDPEWSRHHSKEYYALSYNTTKDPNYKGAIAPGYSWMHVKI